MRSVAVIAALVLATGCGAEVAPGRDAGLTVPARVQGRSLEIATKKGFAPVFWPGVNLGSTIPGHQPGEVAATRRDYDRWLSGIGALHARVIRIYTILRPAFYDALAAYNRAHADRPLYFIQGVWLPGEEEFDASGNAYLPSITDGFKSEIDDAVAVAHGAAVLPRRRGHAGGRYRANVSRWLLAYSLGIEWDPTAVDSTDRRNAGVAPFAGRYFTASADATPFESWLASMLDHAAADEAARGSSRPLTFTNWLTLDPLHHPDEPLPTEDLVSVDATHIAATSAWPGGFFASYHAYPYYPDFLRLTPSYQTYRRARDGKVDPYAGYLHDLRAYHGNQAVMITEFGVPSSLGMAHFGPAGRNQGDHSEREALRIDGDMLRDIKDEGFAGGIVFEWIDEWFKFTWNTVDFQVADRRQLWHDDLTNEQFFGMIAADPVREPAVPIAKSRGPVREVRASKDEGALRLQLRLNRSGAWRTHPLTIGLDTRPGGTGGLPNHPGVFPAADAALVVGPGHAQLFQAASWEPTRITYGIAAGDAWVHPSQIVNRNPLQVHEVDTRSLASARGKVVDVRLPWAMLGYADPSSVTLYVAHPGTRATTIKGGRVGIAVLSDGSPLLKTRGYAWKPWQRVSWRERKKAGFSQLASTMRKLGR